MARLKENRKLNELQLGLVASFFANAEYSNKENRMSWEPSDFMPTAVAEEALEQENAPEMGDEQTFDFIRTMNAALGGKEAVDG